MDYFEDVNFSAALNQGGTIYPFFSQYRYMLLPESLRTALEHGGASQIAQTALARIYGAFSTASFDSLSSDPFLLTDAALGPRLQAALKSAGSLSVRDGVLCGVKNGLYYVMLRAELTPAASSFSRKLNAVPWILAQVHAVERDSGVRIFYSGVPFHSWRSSTTAQTEISIISSTAFVIVIIMLLLVFRSPAPILLPALAMLLSGASAMAGAFLFFPQVHLITMVFGTTLIGCCIDYSLHFFCHRDVREITRSITFSFISTQVCFALLLFAPFSILRQFAVFSLFGMASSYLTVLGLLPSLKIAKRIPDLHRAHAGTAASAMRRTKGIILCVLAAASVIVIIINIHDVRVKNDITALYKMPPDLMENEKVVSTVMGYRTAPWYFIVRGDSADDVLEKESALLEKLAVEVKNGNAASYMGTSLFIPPVSVQKKSYEDAAALLPLAEKQFLALGFSAEDAKKSADTLAVDYRQAEGNYLTPSNALGAALHGMPVSMRALLSNLWLGKIDNAYYSAVLLTGPKKNAEYFTTLVPKNSGVFLLNKTGAISSSLDALTRTMLIIFLAAYIIIVIIVNIFFPRKAALKISAVPLLTTLVTLAVMLACGLYIGFFEATAYVLVFGLGLDYIIYTVDTKNTTSASVLAIALSYATTALSFGALALSSFIPVHTFGLVVLAGLSAAFVFAFLLRGNRE
jgi:predicted exporter